MKYRRIFYVIVVLVVVIVGVRLLTGGRKTVAESPLPTATSASATTEPPPATSAATSAPAATDPAPTGTGSPVPSVVGHRLTNALEELVGHGFANVLPVDAAGQKVPVNPENWIVLAQDPAAGVVSPPTTRVRLTVSKPEETPGTGTGGVPEVVCSGLPEATTALTEAGYSVATRDGTGRGRLVLVESNWLVTAQSEPAGSRPARGTEITVTIVKFGESTGSSGCHS